MTVYLATCLVCEPPLPEIFDDAAERDRWADAHTLVTGHRVARHRES